MRFLMHGLAVCYAGNNQFVGPLVGPITPNPAVQVSSQDPDDTLLLCTLG